MDAPGSDVQATGARKVLGDRVVSSHRFAPPSWWQSKVRNRKEPCRAGLACCREEDCIGGAPASLVDALGSVLETAKPITVPGARGSVAAVFYWSRIGKCAWASKQLRFLGFSGQSQRLQTAESRIPQALPRQISGAAVTVNAAYRD